MFDTVAGGCAFVLSGSSRGAAAVVGGVLAVSARSRSGHFACGNPGLLDRDDSEPFSRSARRDFFFILRSRAHGVDVHRVGFGPDKARPLHE